MKFYAYFTSTNEEYLVLADSLEDAARAALAHYLFKHKDELDELPEGRWEVMPLTDAYRRGLLVNAEVAFLEEVTYSQALEEFKEFLEAEARRYAMEKPVQPTLDQFIGVRA